MRTGISLLATEHALDRMVRAPGACQGTVAPSEPAYVKEQGAFAVQSRLRNDLPERLNDTVWRRFGALQDGLGHVVRLS
jgi:hypothetical protein